MDLRAAVEAGRGGELLVEAHQSLDHVSEQLQDECVDRYDKLQELLAARVELFRSVRTIAAKPVHDADFLDGSSSLKRAAHDTRELQERAHVLEGVGEAAERA